ncbi:hypothetical protein L1887_55509 [Cichorium endivia]|nr:hypothetical protein L1887_55509 [Cichorium endivia]
MVVGRKASLSGAWGRSLRPALLLGGGAAQTPNFCIPEQRSVRTSTSPRQSRRLDRVELPRAQEHGSLIAADASQTQGHPGHSQVREQTSDAAEGGHRLLLVKRFGLLLDVVDDRRVRDDDDLLGRRKGADVPAHLDDQLLGQRVLRVVAELGLERDVGGDRLTRHLVWDSHHGRLGHTPGAGSAPTRSRPCSRPCRAQHTVAGEEVALVGAHVRVQESLVVAVHRARHRGPRLADRQHTLDVVALEHVARRGVEQHGLDAPEGERRRARLGLGRTGQRRDHDGARLGHPVRVDNGALLTADVVVVPVPSLGVDGLTHRADDAQRRQVVLLDVLVAQAAQQTDRGGRRVELRELVLVHNLPVARRRRVHGCRLENERRHAVHQRTVDDVRVAGDPADVGHAGEAVALVRVHVKDVSQRERGAEQVACGGVHHTLGLAGGARGVEDEERVLGAHRLGRAVGALARARLVPPDVALVVKADLAAGALDDDDVLNLGALLERRIDDALGGDVAPTALAFVGGDDDARAAVVGAVAQRVRREAGKDDRVDGTNARTREQGDGRLGNHGEVDDDRVALPHAERLEHVGGLRDLDEQLRVGDLLRLAGLVGLVDDGDAVGGDIAILEAAGSDRLEGNVPVDDLLGDLLLRDSTRRDYTAERDASGSAIRKLRGNGLLTHLAKELRDVRPFPGDGKARRSSAPRALQPQPCWAMCRWGESNADAASWRIDAGRANGLSGSGTDGRQSIGSVWSADPKSAGGLRCR